MLFWGILEYSAAVTIIGLLIWLVKVIFHDKLDARWHSFIWLVLVVRLLVPVRFELISVPVSVFSEIPLGKWMEMGRLLAEKKGYEEGVSALGKIWLWGAVFLGGFYLTIWGILRIRLERAPKADGYVRKYVDGVAEKYGLKSCSDIRILKSSTPYICGVVRPVLVLPDDWRLLAGRERAVSKGVQEDGDRLEGERTGETGIAPMESVIVHELLHMRYGDVAVNLGIHLVRVINWFNPFIWVLTAVMQNDSEALCDQRVLEYCGKKMYGITVKY